MSGYTRPTMVGDAPPVMEDYTGYSSTAPTWARLRPTRAAAHTALAPVDVWSAKPSTHAGVNADRSSTAPLPRKVLKAKLPTAPQAPAPARTSRSTGSSEQWAAMNPPPRGLSAVLEMTEDDGADFDTSETASMSSELSTSTQATSVASDDTITAKDGSKVGARNTLKVIHPAPIATTTARLKARPRARPLPPSEPSTAALSKSPTASRRTLHIQVTPSQELTTQQKKVEKDLRHKIEQLESETQSLRSEQNRLLEELDSTSERLSVTGQEKKDVVKERNRERDTRQLLYSDLEDQRKILEEFRNKNAEQKAAITGIENERDLLRSDLDEQRRILDEFRSNFGLQKGMLDEAEKERDELRESKAMFEEKAKKLGKELAQALEDRKDHEGLLIAQIAALELTKGALDSRIDTRDKEIVDLIVVRENSKKEAEEHEAQIKTLTEAKEAQLKTLTEEKETQVKVITEEKDAQIKTLTEEKEALAEAKKAADEEKEKAVGQVTEITAEKDKESQELQIQLDSVKEEREKLKTEVETLAADNESLQKQLDDLEAETDEHQATINTMTVDLGGAKDANITLAAQKLDADTETGKVKEQLATAQAEITKLEEAKKALESENEELKSRPADVIKVEVADGSKPADDASSDDTAKELAAEVAKVAGLTVANEELQTKIGELGAEAEKAAGLAEEKAALETKVAELEKQASEVPALAEHNKALSSQLADANARLGQIHAAHQAATAQVQDLMSQVALLRARQPSQSRSSSRKRKSTVTDSKALVVVRNPSDRGSLQIMRKCDLRPPSPKRSSSSVTDSESQI